MENGASVEAFYDDLADEYHLIFEDWWASALRHGEIIEAILGTFGLGRRARVLDCTCGIGTQALPLALLGYTVVGSDISARSVERARREAKERGIAADFLVCDVRDLDRAVPTGFDVALACDNSLPHLPTDAELAAALRSIRRCLSEGGVFLASIRNYDELAADRPTGVVPVAYSSGDGTRIVGQAWEWSERGDTVLIRLFVLREREGRWSCSLRTTRYRALRRSEMDRALIQAGFDDVTWHAADETGYHQPIVTARASRVGT